MKKVLLTLIAVLMAVPAFAIEVYNNDENVVDIYGTLRGYIGYGHGMNSSNDAVNDDFLYGIQGNSRIGVKLKIGNFSGQVELGANEKTLLTGATGTVGLRQAWGAYSFGNAGTLLAGKTDTPTTMVGFSSDFIDTDSGLKGFGGNGTGNRRFQIAYRVMGLDIALIEDDMTVNAGSVENYSDYNKTIPRIAISYTYNNPSLIAKVGATYSALNGNITTLSDPDTRWATIHAFGVVAGVKPTFLDGKMWLSVQARYGMNEHLYGEATTVYNTGSFSHSAFNSGTVVDADGTVNNIYRVNVMAELGYKVNDSFSALIGGGYQLTMYDASGKDDVNSFGVYIQAPYSISKNFALIPQVSYLSTDFGINTVDAVLVAMQARITF